MMTYHSDLGARLHIVLAERNVSKKDFAAKMDVAPTQVSRWINSKTMKLSQIVAICEALKMPVMEFITDEA
jgi:DNA-binding Xre family transcriptional regulator